MPKKKPAGSKRASKGTTSKTILAAVALAIAAGEAPAKEYTGWITRDEQAKRITSSDASSLVAQATKLTKVLASFKKLDLNMKAVVDAVKGNCPNIVGMVTNGNTIGFTTDEHKPTKQAPDYRMLVTVPVSEHDLEMLKEKLPGGKDILGDDKVYYDLANLS